jgi:hypothetical protein
MHTYAALDDGVENVDDLAHLERIGATQACEARRLSLPR